MIVLDQPGQPEQQHSREQQVGKRDHDPDPPELVAEQLPARMPAHEREEHERAGGSERGRGGIVRASRAASSGGSNQDSPAPGRPYPASPGQDAGAIGHQEADVISSNSLPTGHPPGSRQLCLPARIRLRGRVLMRGKVSTPIASRSRRVCASRVGPSLPIRECQRSACRYVLDGKPQSGNDGGAACGVQHETRSSRWSLRPRSAGR